MADQQHPEGLPCGKCGTVLIYKTGFKSNRWACWACPKGKPGSEHTTIWL